MQVSAIVITLSWMEWILHVLFILDDWCCNALLAADADYLLAAVIAGWW